MNNLDKIYNAITQAETGSFNNPYIRTTQAPKGGSTAFGPAQLTQKTALDYLKRGLLKPENAKFLQEVMVPMYQNFTKYGKETNKPGYDPIYDYGGGGGFDPKNADQYKSLAMDVLEDMPGATDLERIQSWRGKKQEQDPRYFKSAIEALK